MKMLSVLFVMLFCFSVLVFAQDGLKTQVEAVPKVFKVTPSGTATLPAARWPQFSNCNGEAECCATLAGLSLQYRNGAPQFSDEDLGLTLDVPIDKAYRTRGSILIAWTLRIEGRDAGIINPWGTLCGAWHGSVVETFKGGQIYSQAYVNSGSGFKALGQPASMTIPDGGTGVNVNVNDPTHSGSYLLKATDPEFPNGFPATVTIKVYWKNDTAQIITSSAAYRSLIATVLPTSE